MRILLWITLLFGTRTLCAQVINTSEIDIMRDAYGVPHIYAPTDVQVAYGLAWAHAEDDFQTIQLTMLSGKGMLGAHLGKQGAAVDYVVALLDCQKIARNQWDSLSEDYQKIITSYTAGLNAYAVEFPEKVLLKESFPITVQEVLSAYVLSLAVISGADQVIGNLVNGKVDEYVDLSGKGSNAFAFNRSKTKDGQVYLNINSHQPLEGPTAWYEAHLISDEGWNALGGLFPGGATIFHGTNPYLGWAHTVNYPDKIDIFQLEMDSENDLKYRFDNEWKTLDSKQVKLSVQILFGIKIRVKKPVYRSIYGPVIKNDKGYFAFDLGALHDLRAPEQWYRMNKATDWKSFKAALEMVAIPGFNIVYADREDNIYYVGNAKIPMRNPDYNWQRTLPGNTSETRPQTPEPEYHPLEDLPQVFNPEAGYVFNTNNSAFNSTANENNAKIEDYDPTMGYREFENNRSTRFMELVQRYDVLSWDDFLQIKYDDTLPKSLAYPVDLSALWTLDSASNPKYGKLINILKNWDRSSHYQSIGAAQFMILYRYLVNTYRKYYAGTPYPLTPAEALDAVAYTQKYLKKNFKQIDIALGDYQLLVRGSYEMPVNGILDVLTAMDAKPYKDGRVRAHQGESYIQLVRFPKEGLPIIESVNVYGASNQPESPHYRDQMMLFLKQKRKPMTLDLEEVRRTARSIYHPG